MLVAGACGTEGTETTNTTVESTTSTAEPATTSTTRAPTTTLESTTTTAQPAAPQLADSSALCTPASDEVEVINVGADYADGDTIHLELEKMKTGTALPAGAGTTPITIDVEQVDQNGSLLRWRSGETTVAGFSAEDLAAAGLSLDDAPRQNILYRVDPSGFFAGFENIDEMRATADEALEFIAPIIEDEQLVEQLRQVYGGLSDEEFTTTFAEEPTLFHVFDGATLAVDDKLEEPDILPNAFGGEPFPAISTLAVTNVQDSDGCVEITLTTTLDPEEGARILLDSVSETFDIPLEEIDEAATLESFDLENVVVVRVDYPTGQVQQVVGTQRITVEGQTRVETLTITRVVDPDAEQVDPPPGA